MEHLDLVNREPLLSGCVPRYSKSFVDITTIRHLSALPFFPETHKPAITM